MDKKINDVYKQEDLLKMYIKLIEEECENYYIDYLIDEEKKSTLEDVQKYKVFYKSLDSTCVSNIFKELCSFIYQVPKTCSFLACLSSDGGSTTYRLDKDTKIVGCVSLDLPPYNRSTMDYIYLHEAVHGLYYDSRKGKKFIDSPNVEVLPYFFMLYALDNLHDKYEEETINSIIGRFIVNPYSSAKNILHNLDNKFLHYTDLELKCNFYLDKYELDDIKERKENIYLDYQQFLGPIKTIILYRYCLDGRISFEDVLNSVLDSEKEIGEEIEYDLLDVSKEDNINLYKNFLKTHKKVLPLK